MIIWQRWGIVVAFAAIAGLTLSLVVIQNLLTIEPAYAKASLSVAIGFFIAAVLSLGLWLLRFFNVIDAPIAATTPGTKAKRPPSTLFYVPIIAWPVIFAALGVLGLIVGFSDVGSA